MSAPLALHQNSVARCAAEKLIERRVQALALRSHRAVSTAEIADMVTGPRRQYAPLQKYCQLSSILRASRPINEG
jgi:hypothetical protein